MADTPFNESGLGDFNKDLEANIKRLERLSKAADDASGNVDKLSDTYNKLAQLAEGKIQFKVSGLKSLKFLIDIDDAKFAKLTKNLEQLDNISKKFDIKFKVSGLKGIDKLQNIDIAKIKESLKSLEETAKEFQNIDINSTINVSDDLVKGLSRLERLSRFDVSVLSNNLKSINDASKNFEDIDITNTINVSDDLVKGLSRLERLSRFDVDNLANTLKSLKEASKDFENIDIDAVINVSDGLVKGLSTLERLSRFDVDKLNKNIAELQKLASEPINIDMKININSDELDKIKEINELLKNYKLINKNNTSDGEGKVKEGKNSKSKKGILSTIIKLSDTATSALKPVNVLASSITKLGIATGGAIAVLTLLARVTVEAQKNTSSYARSMAVMNKELSSVDKQSLETANKINKLNNKMSNLIQGVGDKLYPILEFIVDSVNNITPDLSGSERKDIIANTKANISSTAHQSGMTRGTGNALADNTYSIALGLTDKYGEQASVIADKLASAWETGSDAAKNYGVVLNDNVLTGYLWSKGIDIVNVEITDAMKQYYRYQLMVEQTSGKVTDSMIKDWTSLGFMIDKTKGKLFSFDEVIQLVAADPTIPGMTGGSNSNEGITGHIGSPGGSYTPPGGFPTSPYGVLPSAEILDAAGVFNTAADKITLAADNMSNTADVTITSFSSIYDYIVQGSQVLTSAINGSMNQAAYTLNTVTRNGVELLDQATVNGINSLNKAALSGIGTINSATNSGVNTINGATNSGVNTLNKATNSGVNIISSTAKNWITQIQKAGQQILNKKASVISKSFTDRKTAGATNVYTPKTNTVGSLGSLSILSNKTKTSTSNNTIESKYDKNTLNTAQKIASKNNADFNKLSDKDKEYYAIIAKEVNKNPVLTIKDGVDMFNSYKSTGKAKTWWDSKAADNVGTGLGMTAAVLGSTGLALSGFAGAASVVSKIGLPLIPIPGMGFADGGIGTREINNATLFEGNKKEAVIPLESNEGIEYLANAMSRAGAGNNNNKSGDIVVNLTLSGLNLANNDAEWERVGRKIGEVIDIQKQRRGELDYGSSF